MNTINLASQLSNSYIERSERKLDLERLEAELYKREVFLTPLEGWAGKNAEQRELDRARFLGNDETYQAIQEKVREQKDALSLLAGTIEALEAERRGVEWDIRANLVTVMAGKLRGETSVVVEDAAFDDAAGCEMDYQVFGDALEQAGADDYDAMTLPEEYHTSPEEAVDELPF
jgi:hypothetical protein